MSETNQMIQMSFVEDKNGTRAEIVDAAARASANANAQNIAAISEEVENLKEEGGISGGTTTTVSGKLLTVDCDVGAEIEVSGETAEAVTLVHCGKNLLPFMSAATITSGNVKITQHADGTITVNGTAGSGDTWPDYIPRSAPIRLAAGTYTLSSNNTSPELQFSIAKASDKSNLVRVSSVRKNTVTLSEDTDVYLYFTVGKNATFSNVNLAIQLEVGSVGTEYETHISETVINVKLPHTVSAYAGVNNIHSDDYIELEAMTRKSVGSIVNDAVKKQLEVDWSAYGLPILYLTGDTSAMTKDDAVDLAYKYGDMSGTASVKWQGSSSINYPKKNYTIKFDQEFETVEGWGAQKKYCFKANYIDHSHARNICSSKLWGQIVKSRANVPTELSSLVNGGAIDGFPCIIMLNGDFHGLFTWNIPKDGWMFGSPKAILCADAHTDATKFKALATLNGDFELEYVEDEDNAEWVLASINTAIQAVMNKSSLDIIGQYIDISSAIDYYIHTVDENADDGTDKNYILVTFDGVKWYFSAYDRDTTYGRYWDGSSFTSPSGGITFAKYASVHALMNLILANKADELKARAIELRDGIKSEANVATLFCNFVNGIPSQVLDEDARKWPTIPGTSASNLAQIFNWYRLRRQVIDKEIDAMS